MLDREKDYVAAKVMDMLMSTHPRLHESFKRLRNLIEGKAVLIVGAGSNCRLVSDLHRYYEQVIAADGAYYCCREVGIIPGIIVTDLDGVSLKDLRRFEGISVIHAHGDNIDKVVWWVPLLKNSSVVGTVQTFPPSPQVNVFGGFTDGDRAAYLAYFFRPRRIGLVGFDFSGEVGKYSKLGYGKVRGSLLRRKMEKLNWASRLLTRLIVEGDVDVQCHSCKGFGRF